MRESNTMIGNIELPEESNRDIYHRLQDAIDSLRVDNGGPGIGRITLPPGPLTVNRPIDVDLDQCSISIRMDSAGYRTTILNNVGGPAMRLHSALTDPGTPPIGKKFAQNMGFFELEGLGFGSIDDDAVQVCAQNWMMRNCWFFSSAKAYLNLLGGGTSRAEGLRFGPGNLGDNNAKSALLFGPLQFEKPDYFILSRSSVDNMQGENIWVNCWGHGGAKVACVMYQSLDNWPVGMNSFTDCRFKAFTTDGPSVATYVLDGGSFQVAHCYSEMRGQYPGGVWPDTVVVKGTNAGCDVRLIDVVGNGGSLKIFGSQNLVSVKTSDCDFRLALQGDNSTQYNFIDRDGRYFHRPGTAPPFTFAPITVTELGTRYWRGDDPPTFPCVDCT